MAMNKSNILVKAGERITIVNHSETSTTYRTEFPGAGSVSFVVLAHGEFSVESVTAGPINIYIDHITEAGISPVCR